LGSGGWGILIGELQTEMFCWARRKLKEKVKKKEKGKEKREKEKREISCT